MVNDNKSIVTYISHFNNDVQNRLQALRVLVQEIAPNSTEQMVYGIIGYKLQQKPLVYFGAFANHVGIYAIPSTHKEFASELSSYKQGKGSLQLPHNRPLPIPVISAMIAFRKKELDDAHNAKGKNKIKQS